MKTRAQTIVAMLYDDVKGIKQNEVVKLRNEGRAKQVPGMLLRHGLLQVVAFMRRVLPIGAHGQLSGKPAAHLRPVRDQGGARTGDWGWLPADLPEARWL